ncbi:NUDIX hydrolase [Marinoscillum furvescens]|uniref:ADP-ribose pyrophosphatase YjhB (NUDIX family) n=1 Tax=Marinoscillum furvescens DSM 4134 TaxID=1122208 RepID=A0A3D9KYA0_MARFU|nr:NUDIX hydrolase [Marinoscillum furvescens]RED93211.1 ADP-ribose pyrophosphatase YjhB (NUDIX family) [Marinoscillum furvescens DSM 4134]
MTYSHPKLLVAIDCLVFGYDLSEESLNILAFQRKVEPYAGDWSLIGSFINEGEDMSQAARRVLKQFTGLDDVFLEQLHVYGNADRDPGGHVLSILHWSLIKLDDLHKETAEKHGARWFPIDQMPELVLDHGDMVQLGMQKLVTNAKTRPLGFELLPEEFTLPQLKRLYDAIYGRQLDDRNFRKRMLSTELLEKLDKKDKSTSKKGAFLHKFNKEKYEELAEKGYLLDLDVK